MSVTIVTGLGCSGKTTYADSLSSDTTRHTDTLKFHAGWQPPDTYLANLRAHVNPDNPDAETVFEHDPRAPAVMRTFVRDLIASKQLAAVVCFESPATALEQATRLLTRSFNRLLGTCPHNPCGAEQPGNVSCMMQSTFAHFADACAALHELRDLCATYHFHGAPLLPSSSVCRPDKRCVQLVVK